MHLSAIRRNGRNAIINALTKLEQTSKRRPDCYRLLVVEETFAYIAQCSAWCPKASLSLLHLDPSLFRQASFP